ncbi:hypothetical protein [Flavobacterium yafengii]|uniref:hypothetical protein n=1 Tax=Flavobacterium yafengii TaxID=3041253 RepID=UPI0024A9868D|nr:hypothetical protein [Flavobacterium yafengii]MDI5886534.1 hypothetical protein [Flavobacterium yafengii]
MRTEDKVTLRNQASERLDLFFKEITGEAEMAKQIRRMNYVLSMATIGEKDEHLPGEYWVKDGLFWLNELAEVLDPSISID